jgi:hypothetical protein
MVRSVRRIAGVNLYDENGVLTFTEPLKYLCDRFPRVLGRTSHTIPCGFCLGNHRRHGRCIGL